MWSICVPAESLVVVYNTRHILTFGIPNFSRLSPGANLLNKAPTWRWPGDPERIDRSIWTQASYVTGEALYDPLPMRKFNLHYVCRDRVGTVTIPIGIGGHPLLRFIASLSTRESTTLIPYHQKDWIGFSSQKGLHFEKAVSTEGFRILVTRLDDLVLGGRKKTLRMFVPYGNLGYHPRKIEMDMDEATGRVIFWGVNERKYEVRVFVGDLV